jgi:hypothetical protein
MMIAPNDSKAPVLKVSSPEEALDPAKQIEQAADAAAE